MQTRYGIHKKIGDIEDIEKKQKRATKLVITLKKVTQGKTGALRPSHIEV